MVPYYQEDGITIYCGDCREILPTLTFGCVISDPPYGISHPTDYAARGRSKLAQCRNYAPVFADNSPFDPSWLLNWPCILWGANHYASKLPDSSGWLVWDKLRPDELDQSRAELAWSNFVKGCRVFPFLWNGMMRASDELLEHPTQKPVALMKWCINQKWTPTGVIADPYMGSGTTLVAAKDMGREAIGFDVEERYCEIAAKRLSQSVFDFGPSLIPPTPTNKSDEWMSHLGAQDLIKEDVLERLERDPDPRR